MATQDVNIEAVDSLDNEEAAEPTFGEQVNEVVSKMKQDDKGNWQLPEGEYPEEVKFAANLERRRRDTESFAGKLKNELNTKDTLLSTYKEKIAERVQVNLSDDDKTRLEELKYSDPEAWRKEMNKLEREAKNSLSNEIEEESKKVTQQNIISERERILADFNKEHQDVQITQDVVDNDIPPRITKKLADGKITFEEFLNEAYKFLTSGKVIKKDVVGDITNIGEADGGADPSDDAKQHKEISDYEKTVF